MPTVQVHEHRRGLVAAVIELEPGGAVLLQQQRQLRLRDDHVHGVLLVQRDVDQRGGDLRGESVV